MYTSIIRRHPEEKRLNTTKRHSNKKKEQNSISSFENRTIYEETGKRFFHKIFIMFILICNNNMQEHLVNLSTSIFNIISSSRLFLIKGGAATDNVDRSIKNYVNIKKDEC